MWRNKNNISALDKRCMDINEPVHDKTYKMAYASSEDSDQPVHPHSLIRVFVVSMKKAWILSYLLSTSKDSNQIGQMPRQV